MSRPATLAQLRALAEDLVRAHAKAGHAVAVAAPPTWTGPEQFEVGALTVRVRPAATVLAVHDALASHDDDSLLLVLTDRPEHELDLDVMARLARTSLLRLDRWSLLRARFRLGERGLDAGLRDAAWLADALIQHEPADGWPALPTGFLDRATAWRYLRTGWLGLGGDTLTLADVVAWAATAEGSLGLATTDEAIRDGVLAHAAADAGDPAGLLLGLAVAGRHDDVVPLGLVCAVLFGGGADDSADVVQARVRLEYQLDQHRLSAVAARAWADAATVVARRQLADDGRGAIEPALVRAERLLDELRAPDEAQRSDLLPAGFEQRMAAAGTALAGALDGTDTGAAEFAASVERAERHVLRDPDRIAGLRAAARILRRRDNSPADEGVDLLGVATRYRTDGAFVDACRLALRQGDRVPALAAAYSRLLAQLDTEREAQNAEFGRLLAVSSALEPAAPFLPVERMLDELVVPLVASGPALLVILDGAALTSTIDLLTDVERAGWALLAPDGDRPEPVALAGLPTTTEVSRTSLFCGARTVGTADDELKGFRRHAGLRAAIKTSADPVLFHKGKLSTSDGEPLGSEVRSAIANVECRVVAVVVNAIDDHLNRGQQVAVRWGLETLRPLGALLAEAAAARRTVIITSDHGHVLDERRSALRPHKDSGERDRSATPPAGDGEVLLTGPRVMRDGGSMVAPWTEALHYAGNKHGYHGGVTPQEVLIPLHVLARIDAVPAGWTTVRPAVPVWWSTVRPAAAPVAVAAPVPPKRRGPAKTAGQTDLFGLDDVPATSVAPSRPAWIDALLASETWAAQQRLTTRPLDEALAADMLACLHRRGGTVASEVIGADLNLPNMRVRGLVQVLVRQLNVEGYQVLELLDGGATVRLDVRLLARQFEVTV